MRNTAIYMKLFVLALSLFALTIAKGQNTTYEINMSKDSIDIEPTFFIRNFNTGFVGIVKQTPIYDGINKTTPLLYEIDKNGVSDSIIFVKQDTIFGYYDIISVNDSLPGYLLTGVGFNIYENPLYKFYIFTRLDTNLNIIWEKVYTFDYVAVLWMSKILQLVDGSFLYACSPSGSPNTFMFKLSSQGDSLDYMAYTGDDAGEVWGLSYNYDSTLYLLHTYGAHYSGNTSSCSMVYINKDLEQIAYKFYPDFYTKPYNSLLSSNGEIITGGSSWWNYPQGVDKNYIAGYKLDTSLNILNEVFCTDPDIYSRGAEIKAIDYYYPSCIYLGGNHNIQGTSPSWFYITKLNENMEIEYEKYIVGDADYWLYSVVASTDGGVMLAGTRTPVGAEPFHRDGYFIKLDSTGCITNTTLFDEIQIKDVILYPNPSSEVLNIRTALFNCQFILYDLSGKQILEQEINAGITNIIISNLDSDTYLYIIRQNNNIIDTGKWIKY